MRQPISVLLIVAPVVLVVLLQLRLMPQLIRTTSTSRSLPSTTTPTATCLPSTAPTSTPAPVLVGGGTGLLGLRLGLGLGRQCLRQHFDLHPQRADLLLGFIGPGLLGLRTLALLVPVSLCLSKLTAELPAFCSPHNHVGVWVGEASGELFKVMAKLISDSV